MWGQRSSFHFNGKWCDPGAEVVLAQRPHMGARLVLMEKQLKQRSAWKIPAQVRDVTVNIKLFIIFLFSLVSLVPVDQLQQVLWLRVEDQGKRMRE